MIADNEFDAQLRRRISERISAEMKKQRYNITTLSEVTGIDYKTVSTIKKGDKNYTIDNLETILKVLGIEIELR
ncbi:MAG: helix-turn-helix domain-containing protein [Muribaculaceae bacterium]|nr:helix-turn-helix domain-containing protein [Muribaculaceae bacterium]